MKVFKTIFRLDFASSAYKILDKLGEYYELIDKKINQKPFSEGKGNINPLNHSLTQTAKVADDILTLNLDLRTFNAIIEFQNGKDVDELAKNPLFPLADQIIEKIETEHYPKYKRIGIRSFIIIQRGDFKFEKLRDYIWNCNKIFGEPLTSIYENRYDIGIIFEASSNDEEYIRFKLGPYQKKEQAKYFSLKNNIEEGLIFDIDNWQSNISIPNLTLVKLIRQHQKTYNDLVKKIESKILEDLK